jgi:predicted RNase H-like HicB family nuclease
VTRKVSVVLEQDQHGCYAWCPELKGCQSEGRSVEDALTNIREAIELYFESLTDPPPATASQ